MDLLCQIRDIYRSIAEFESRFQAMYDLSLNEGMLLCSLAKAERCSSGEIAAMLELSNSNASKVICAVEKKGFIDRVLGEKDKRQMYFTLTEAGRTCLDAVQCCSIEIPETLKKLIDK